MRALRVLILTVMAVLTLAATAYGAGYAVRHFDSQEKAVRVVTDPRPSSTAPTPTSTPTPSPGGPTVQPAPDPIQPAWVLRRGDRGDQVRELQHRLFQMAWLPEATTGRYDANTSAAVKGFQAKRGLEPTGTVDQRTWRRLRAMTEQPTRDQLHNLWHPGPTLLGPGASGDQVRDAQARLIQIQWLFGDVTGTYDAATLGAVKGFQDKRGIPVTGAIDQRTLDRLVAMTTTPSHDQMYNVRPEPGGIDPRCQTGRVLCIDKSSNSMRWMVDGSVVSSYDVRFGSTLNNTPTREGQFSVYLKSRDHVSKLYGSAMPFAMFFSGGQAVHYSSDFAAVGYNGASHGCVNVRDYDGIAWLFDQVQIGDKVVIYWS